MNPNASEFIPSFLLKKQIINNNNNNSTNKKEESWEDKIDNTVDNEKNIVKETIKEDNKLKDENEKELMEELKRIAIEEGKTVEELLTEDENEKYNTLTQKENIKEKENIKTEKKKKKEDIEIEKKDDIEEEKKTEEIKEDFREHINVVFIGHVDAGKSTLSGNILLLTGQVDPRTVQKYEKEAKEKNRDSWFLAYIMDTNEEERAKGKTVEVGRASFETTNKRYTILDAPGHKNYIPNMIIGAQQADIAILVISARKGEFETGFNRGGQTREHALLVKTLGVKLLVVVVNKMDDPTVEWSEARYNEIVSQLTPFLKQCGYNISTDVFFVPVSGIKGTNIKDPMPKEIAPWYKGTSLLNTLDNLKPIERMANAPLRIPVMDKIKERGVTVAFGKVEAGTVKKGDSLMIMPGKVQVEVLGIYTDTSQLKTAKPGENLKLMLRGIEEENLHKGFVICDPKFPVPCQTKFEAQLVIVELLPHKSIFTAGYSAVIHIHCVVEECTVVLLTEKLDKKTGKCIEKRPKFVKTGSVCKVILECNQPICVELFSDLPQLGRFTLRDEGKTIAFGKITSLGKKKQQS